MDKLKTLFYVFLLMLLPLRTDYKIPNLFVEKKDIDQGILYNKTQILIKEKEKITEKEVKDFFCVSNPFYVIYDKMGTKIELYYYNTLLTTFNYLNNFPRLSGRFLLLFSSDMMSVKVRKIETSFPKKVFKVSTQDFITAFTSSKNGKYLLIGDMNAQIYAYERNKKPFKFSIKGSRINYIRGLDIDNDGNFVGIGGIYPNIVFTGNIHNIKEINFFTLPSLPRRHINLRLAGDNFVVEGEKQFYVCNNKGILLSLKKKGKLVEFLPGKNITEYLLIEKKNKRYLIRVLKSNRFLYTISIISDFLPLIYTQKDETYIYFYDIGVIRW